MKGLFRRISLYSILSIMNILYIGFIPVMLSPWTEIPAGRNDEDENLESQELLESKLPRNELTSIKILPLQIKEIGEQNDRIEHQLKGMSKDIKQINQTRDNKLCVGV